MMVLVLLQDREDAGRRRMPLLSGGARREPDPGAVAIDVNELIRNRNDDGDRTLRRQFRIPTELAGLQLVGFLRDGDWRQPGCKSGRTTKRSHQKVAAIKRSTHGHLLPF